MNTERSYLPAAWDELAAMCLAYLLVAALVAIVAAPREVAAFLIGLVP